MKKSILVGLGVGLLISGIMVIAESRGKTENSTIASKTRKVPVVIACRARGDLDLFVLSPSSDTSGSSIKESVVLEVPTTHGVENASYWEGGSIFFGSEPDGGCWTRFGHKMMENGILVFQQNGERSAWLNFKDMTIYENIEGKATAIAIVEYSRSYKSPSGDILKADMTKRLGKDEKRCFKADDGKVYLQEDNGKIAQIGFLDWRVITLPNSDKLLLIMTKGMDKNSKWQGKHNGKLYIEK